MWRGVVAEHSDLTWPVGASATGSLARRYKISPVLIVLQVNKRFHVTKHSV